MFAVGHKHTLDKRSYYLIDFKRSGTYYKYKLISEYDGILELNETFHHNPDLVPCLEPNTAQKTLGHFLAVDGNCNEHFSRMMSKLRRWANSIKSSALSGVDRVASYHGYIEKSIQYMISTSSLSFEQSQQLASAVPAVLFNY